MASKTGSVLTAPLLSQKIAPHFGDSLRLCVLAVAFLCGLDSPGAAQMDVGAVDVARLIRKQITHRRGGIIRAAYIAGRYVLTILDISSRGALPVSMKPGEMQFTVIPCGASIFASVRVRISTPTLAM